MVGFHSAKIGLKRLCNHCVLYLLLLAFGYTSAIQHDTGDRSTLLYQLL